MPTPLINPNSQATTCSFGGETIEAVKGVFLVPDEAVPELLAHGFQVAPQKTRAAKPASSEE